MYLKGGLWTENLSSCCMSSVYNGSACHKFDVIMRWVCLMIGTWHIGDCVTVFTRYKAMDRTGAVWRTSNCSVRACSPAWATMSTASGSWGDDC